MLGAQYYVVLSAHPKQRSVMSPPPTNLRVTFSDATKNASDLIPLFYLGGENAVGVPLSALLAARLSLQHHAFHPLVVAEVARRPRAPRSCAWLAQGVNRVLCGTGGGVVDMVEITKRLVIEVCASKCVRSRFGRGVQNNTSCLYRCTYCTTDTLGAPAASACVAESVDRSCTKIETSTVVSNDVCICDHQSIVVAAVHHGERTRHTQNIAV